MVLQRIRRAIWVGAWATLLAYVAAMMAALPHHTLYVASQALDARTWFWLSIGCLLLDGIMAWRTRTALLGGQMQVRIYLISATIFSQGVYASQFLRTGDWGSFLLYTGCDLFLIWMLSGGMQQHIQRQLRAHLPDQQVYEIE